MRDLIRIIILAALLSTLIACETRSKPKLNPNGIQGQQKGNERIFPYCEEITDEETAIEIAQDSEKLINRNHQFQCDEGGGIWSLSTHRKLKSAGFKIIKFKAHNYKPNDYQRRLELNFWYEDSKGNHKNLHTSCEMNVEAKEWIKKNNPPEC